MNELAAILKSTWENEIKEEFSKGNIAYERQCQAMLYFYLRPKLEKIDSRIWIEPVFYAIDKAKPDMVLTTGKHITAIIELKFVPWQFVNYHHDISKFRNYQKLFKGGTEVELGWIPKNSRWKVQKEGEKLLFTFMKGGLLVMATVGRPESEAFTLKGTGLTNFLHLQGWINEDGSIFFGIK